MGKKPSKPIKVTLGKPTKLPNGSSVVIKEKSSKHEPVGKVVSGNQPKNKYTPVGKVVRKGKDKE